MPAMPVHEVIDRRLAAFCSLEEQVGALLPSAWVYCSAQAGNQGRRLIEAASESNAALHAAITAGEDSGGSADDDLSQVEDAANALARDIRDLRNLLFSLNMVSKAAR